MTQLASPIMFDARREDETDETSRLSIWMGQRRVDRGGFNIDRSRAERYVIDVAIGHGAGYISGPWRCGVSKSH